MAIAPEDLAVLTQHLVAKFGKDEFILKCPACRTAAGWTAEGPVVALDYKEMSSGPAEVAARNVIPVVLLICNNCAFVMQFGWLRIRREVLGDG